MEIIHGKGDPGLLVKGQPLPSGVLIGLKMLIFLDRKVTRTVLSVTGSSVGIHLSVYFFSLHAAMLLRERRFWQGEDRGDSGGWEERPQVGCYRGTLQVLRKGTVGRGSSHGC